MDTEQKIKRKDRVSTRKNFLVTLQLEYLTHKLRSIIYRKEPYISVASDICIKKRSKIMELGKCFELPTIFDEGYGVVEFIENSFWNKVGLPNLQYKDVEQQRVQGNFDAWYLFYRGTQIRFKNEIVTVLCNDPSINSLRVLCKGEKRWVNYMEISIITDELNQKLIDFKYEENHEG